MDDHGILHRRRASSTIHVRRDAHGFREIRDPQREIDERVAVLEKRSATSFGTPESPSSATTGELILPSPHADQSAKLSTLKETIELLHIAAETVIVAHDDLT